MSASTHNVVLVVQTKWGRVPASLKATCFGTSTPQRVSAHDGVGVLRNSYVGMFSTWYVPLYIHANAYIRTLTCTHIHARTHTHTCTHNSYLVSESRGRKHGAEKPPDVSQVSVGAGQAVGQRGEHSVPKQVAAIVKLGVDLGWDGHGVVVGNLAGAEQRDVARGSPEVRLGHLSLEALCRVEREGLHIQCVKLGDGLEEARVTRVVVDLAVASVHTLMED
jgi:hypothetical protein